MCAKVDISQCSNWQPPVQKYGVGKNPTQNLNIFILTNSTLKCQLLFCIGNVSFTFF